MLQENNALQVLLDLLALPSVNGTDREACVAEYLKNYFEAHGIVASLQKIDPKRSNVTAFLPGQDSSRTVLWNGHLDTVPCGDRSAWHSDPLVPLRSDGKIYARGASDMKSGLAAMAYALCHLDEKPRCNIRFLGTCDEEKNGDGARSALHGDGVDNISFLLIGEPTALRPGTAQKGCLWLELQVHGRTSHGAYPDKGVNAVEHGVRTARRLSEYVQTFRHPLLGNATAQITGIEGGVANNMTPDRCRIVMDIRMVPPLKTQDVLERANEILQKEQACTPGLDIRFTCLNDRRAIEIDPTHPFVTALQEELSSLGLDPDPIGINFFTDASILDRDGHMDICLFGPGDPALSHQPDEYVEEAAYLDAIRILQRMAVSCHL